ncbi:MAG: YtxH domain-containing protein [Polyangiales bacterium]
MNFRKYLTNMRDYDADDLLGAVGLQKASGADWVFPMLAGLGAGMAIGAGLAFFLTPYKGAEAREKVVRGATDAQRMLSEKVSMLSDKVSSLMGEEAATGTPALGATTGAASKPVGVTPTTSIGGGNTNRSY